MTYGLSKCPSEIAVLRMTLRRRIPVSSKVGPDLNESVFRTVLKYISFTAHSWTPPGVGAVYPGMEGWTENLKETANVDL